MEQTGRCPESSSGPRWVTTGPRRIEARSNAPLAAGPPPGNAAGLAASIRARAIERLCRSADETACLQVRIARDLERRDCLRRADEQAMVWIFHARSRYSEDGIARPIQTKGSYRST